MNENSSAVFMVPSRMASVVLLAVVRTGTGTPNSSPVKKYLRFYGHHVPPLHLMNLQHRPLIQSPSLQFSSSWFDDLGGENKTSPPSPQEGKIKTKQTKKEIKCPKTS